MLAHSLVPEPPFLIIAKVWCCSIGMYMNKSSERMSQKPIAFWFMCTHWAHIWQHLLGKIL